MDNIIYFDDGSSITQESYEQCCHKIVKSLSEATDSLMTAKNVLKSLNLDNFAELKSTD